MLYILLPAYNEEAGIGLVLDAIGALQKELDEHIRVVVVDDGSRDRTADVVNGFKERLDLKFFKFEKNQGVCEVFKTGLKFVVSDSKNPNEDVCVVLDSDNTQDPSVIPQMVRKIRDGDDIVIASRFAPGGGMIGCPANRSIYSVGLLWTMRVFVNLPNVKDYSTFYRAYRVSLLKRGFEKYGDRLIEGKGFAAIGALLIKLGSLTNQISETPLMLRYDFKRGTSGMKVLKTVRGYVELIGQSVKSNRFRNIK